MAFNFRKLFYPVASDLFAPHTHIKALADSILSFVPVANVSERTDVKNAAGAISAANPVAVVRADAAPGRKLEITFDGTTWDVLSYGTWTAYTPALSAGTGAFSLGGAGAVNDCKWRYEGDLVRLRYRLTLGTGFVFPTTDPRIALPVAAVVPPHPFAAYNGIGSARDTTSSGRQDTLIALAPQLETDKIQLMTGTNPASAAGLSPTAPWTWAATHTMQGELTFRPAV